MPLLPLACTLLLLLQVPLTGHPTRAPRPGGGWSDILGVAQTHSGQPIPLAMVTIRRDAESGAPAPGWHDQVLRSDRQGSFRLRVPAQQDYRICVTVPAHREHCQYATVGAADLATLHFVF